MTSRLLVATLHTMLYTGIILTPTIRAHALSDLGDLRFVINTAASRIGAPTNSSRNWGIGVWPPSTGDNIGTADIVANITSTILASNYRLGSNVTEWINVTSTDNRPIPLNLSVTGLDAPYIDYVQSIPNLSAALVALGRSWHRELNRPVYEAIDGLQQGVKEFSSSLLQAGLIHTNATIRTLRAQSTLEAAQLAWSRILNLPGSSTASSGGTGGDDAGGGVARTRRDTTSPPAVESLVEIIEVAHEELKKRLKGAHHPHFPTQASAFTHKELWGRKAADAEKSDEGRESEYESVAESVARQEEQVKALPFNA